ncbi:MAG: hypothetical protein IJI57_11760 [Flexilinea sp.]|nr:hypothetical protein [Flexilinea sp.]
MGFVNCVLYMGFLGVIAYPVGRIISKYGPDPEGFLFKERAWELGGKIYEKLHIKSWQARIPDVSQVLRRWMPQKKLNVGFTAETVRTMISETCTAEAVHSLLNLAGLWLLGLWRGVGGVVMYLIYVILGNLPFILVQRYNRPRLKALLTHLELKEGRVESRPSDPV